MNVTTTIILGGVFAAVSGTAPAGLAPINPVQALNVSAAGIGVDLTAEGLETSPSASTDFKIELRLKSGATIRVRL
ncbi:MAG: hypothetical protein AAF311_12925 [Pseudomonadota bacterium]